MSSYLVTGGAGFIGSHLVDRLLRDGHRVDAVDNFDDFYAESIKRANLADASRHPRFTLFEVDVRNRVAMERLVADRRPQAVVHLAARVGVRASIERPDLYSDVNVGGTVSVLEAAVRGGADRFLLASSSSVYGDNPKVPFSEDDPVDHPISPYAATKRACELTAHVYWALHGLPVTCLRFFTAYGPRCRPDLAVAKFTRLIEAGELVPMFGDGTMKRDFTYVDDIIDGVVRAAEHCEGYHIYNLGNARPIALREMIETIAAALGRRASIDQLDMQPGDVGLTYADVSRARADLGYNPRTPFAEGVARYVAWIHRSAR
ncbi:MAG: GDP-mannose 4,6-dehydratase [Phycisphaerales bacterium]|nr:MAG: GDP-mannose 4,6-dehydratase [Phycisphaerales bacterium]